MPLPSGPVFGWGESLRAEYPTLGDGPLRWVGPPDRFYLDDVEISREEFEHLDAFLQTMDGRNGCSPTYPADGRKVLAEELELERSRSGVVRFPSTGCAAGATRVRTPLRTR